MDHSGHGMDGMNMDLPPFTLARGLEFGGDPFFLVGCLLGLGLYGWAVIRLRRRGDAWPVGRTVAWAVGVLTVALVMCTELNDYGMAMFSVHMVQHMVISMLSPILLLLGAPVTLALRALPAAGRGRKGPRELLVALLHSRYMRIITHPAFTIPLFIASLYALYFSPLFDFLMESRAGHIGDDGALPRGRPGVLLADHGRRPGPAPAGLCDADAGAVRGDAVPRLLRHRADDGARSRWSAPSCTRRPRSGSRRWPTSRPPGGIAWAFSEIPSVVVLIALVFQWYKSEERQSQRADRAADRNGDKDLADYNAYLASLNARGQ